jgi:hypothetical protein
MKAHGLVWRIGMSIWFLGRAFYFHGTSRAIL